VNAPLRRVGVVVLVLFGLLFANLNWVQAYKADEYRNSDYNGRVQIAEYERQRGNIETGKTALAQSKPSDGELKFLREYPFDAEYAHVVGYKPVNLAATGIERTENEFLAGTADALIADRISDWFKSQKTPGGSVLLTVSRRAQDVAFNQLNDNEVGAERGAAVALDPRTGAVQALVSLPSFDPNPLVSHDTEAAQDAYDKLEASPNKPLNNRALGETYPPGSTFKVIDTAAALENGYTPETRIPAGPVYRAPTSGTDIRNAADSICPESEVTLDDALTESCNTGFAQLAVALGAEKIKDKARDFGFTQTDLTVGRLSGANADGLPVAPSETGEIKNPDGSDDPAALAQSGIGQNNVRMTPLQGALIAAAVANDGRQMRPYLVQQLLGPDRTTNHYTASPRELNGSVVSPEIATTMQGMMVNVVEDGTGRSARINGFTVGGKTGTAQSAEDRQDHGWFIGFALRPDGTPVSAVCVFLEEAGPGGSGEAARIGGRIMSAVVSDREGG
jgi:peptidoglycan glycosyltransferase